LRRIAAAAAEMVFAVEQNHGFGDRSSKEPSREPRTTMREGTQRGAVEDAAAAAAVVAAAAAGAAGAVDLSPTTTWPIPFQPEAAQVLADAP
jgi:hypothetical protein